MRPLVLVTVVAIILAHTGKATALTIEKPVTAAWLKQHAKEFSIDAEKRDDGLIHFTITRRLSKPRYLVGHFKVEVDNSSVLESHFPAVVREETARYFLVVSPNYLSGATFDLSEHGFSLEDNEPLPYVGSIVYKIQLADFAP